MSGGTGSGKTTLLNALIELLPEDERIVSIEDTLELRIDHSNCVRFEARGIDSGSVTIRDLVRHALRHRPDHIVVGEVRGGEAADLLQALNTGHGGSLTTIHANNAESALSRLASCAMQGGGDLPWEVTCRGVTDGISMVIHMTRRDGKRYVEEALHVGDYDVDKQRWHYRLGRLSIPTPPPRIERGKPLTDTATRLRKKRTGQVGGRMCFAGIIALAMAGQLDRTHAEARVERVVDGDTRVVRYQGENRTVRLIGVDTPESVHPAEPVEHFGLEAASFARGPGWTARPFSLVRRPDRRHRGRLRPALAPRLSR